LHIINFNNLYFRVENETTLICAKNRVDLSSISEVRSYITEWPHFFWTTLYDLFLMGKLRTAVFDLYIQYILVFSFYKW